MRTHSIRALVRRAFGVLAVGLCLLASPAFGASVAGSIQDETSAGLVGIQVNLWQNHPKNGWEIVGTETTAAAGAYTFVGLSNGVYRVSARVPNSIPDSDTRARRMDKFYDVVAPINDGFTLSAADELNLTATAPDATSIIIPIAKGFGVDGDIAFGGTTLAGKYLRAELRSDFEQHNETVSRATAGEPGSTIRGDFHFRGLEFSAAGNAAEHRIITYDPSGFYEPELALAPVIGGAANSVLAFGTVALAQFSTNPDPGEPNDNAVPGQVTPVDVVSIRAGNPWYSLDAMITPNDVDWYCWDALPDERFVITTSTAEWLDPSGNCCTDQLDGETRYSPWLDPMIRLFRNGTTVEVDADDSAAAGPLDAMIDTGEIVGNPSYCIIVTTYGDSAFNGNGQGTFGRYELEIVMGNRRPTSVITDGTGNTVNDGDGRAMNEGATFTLDIATNDPDGDTPSVTVVLADAGGNDTGMGVYDGGTGEWSWTAGQGDEGGYTVTVTVCDAEVCTVTTLNLTVNGVNIIPTTPVQVDPVDQSMVATATPTLTADNAIDPDPDTITYDFQLYYFTNPGPTPAFAPDQEAVDLTEGGGGQTSWVPSGIPENTTVFWRVRAWDGVDPSSYSPWSGYFEFFVNAVNDSPIAPVLTKPAEGEIVVTRSPTLEVNNTTDPEGDNIDLYYEVATDDTFTTIVQTSPAVPQVTAGTFTTWVDPAVLLDWGTSYAARAYAVDANGAQSSYSNINHFRLTDNQAPSAITLESPFTAAACADVVLAVTPTSITVSNSVDPEAEAVTLDLEIYDFAATPGVDTPVIAILAYAQDPAGSGTVIPIDNSLLAEDSHYRVRARASDGIADTSWAECDMWINTSNSAPGAISILSPTSGTSFPSDTQSVTVTVQNASDAEGAMPGSSLSIVLCASANASFTDCDASPANWQAEPSVADPAQTTDILVTQLADGTLLGPDMTVYVQACALDNMDECGPSDSTDFVIEQGIVDLCANVQCTSPEVCDPATGVCGGGGGTDGGTDDGGIDDGGSGGGGEGSGCCGGDIAHGGRSGLAFAAIFGLLALWTTRRRS